MGCNQSKGVELLNENHNHPQIHKHANVNANSNSNNKGSGSNLTIKTAPTSPALSTSSALSSSNSNNNINKSKNKSRSSPKLKITLPREIQRIGSPGLKLYSLLQLTLANDIPDDLIWTKIVKICNASGGSSSSKGSSKGGTSTNYQDPKTGDTPLHLACRILTRFPSPFSNNNDNDNGNGSDDMNGNGNGNGIVTPLEAMRVLIRCSADILPNKRGYIPLHDILRIAPKSQSQSQSDSNMNVNINMNVTPNANTNAYAEAIIHQTNVVNLILAADFEASLDYLQRTNVVHEVQDGPATPLYHATASLPDDFYHHDNGDSGNGKSGNNGNSGMSSPPTVQFLSAIHFPTPHMVASKNDSQLSSSSSSSAYNNSSPISYNWDKPLALLYRRFSRQFDQSEKFFPGDNSTTEIVTYRQHYKTAAMNTWKLILCLLDPSDRTNVMNRSTKRSTVSDFYMVHAAVRMDCPPDLLRYVIETRPEEVRQTDERGRLPLHVAASAKCIEFDSNNENNNENEHNHNDHDNDNEKVMAGCAASKYHYKFVMDELLYSYPDGAASTDADHKLPLQLAVQSGKSWIGGGTKSLHDVYPDAMARVPIGEFPGIKSALSFSTNFGIGDDNDNDMDSDDGDGDDNSEGGSDGNGIVNGNATNGNGKGVEKEEHYDAIMMVQKPNANLGDIISAMWANEEDAGVQMLGCVAIANMANAILTSSSSSSSAPQASSSTSSSTSTWKKSRSEINGTILPNIRAMALTSVTTVVNAMKNHPNEPIVQEKACIALRLLAPADNYREVSFAASGAAASIVNAMQAHVSDAIVQQEACLALRQIVSYGGAERATVVASVSGITALQNAIGTHVDDEGVQREACLAIEVLTCFPDANLPGKGVGGVGVQIVPLLEAAKSNFPQDCEEAVDTILSRLS